MPSKVEFKKRAGGVLAPLGFLGGAASCGIKGGRAVRPDLALIAGGHMCTAAATFTTNVVKAAPVKLSARHVRNGRAAAVILNSGNANACTGPEGDAAALESAGRVARRLGCEAHDVLVCSTGRIGVQLPVDRIGAGIDRLDLGRTAGEDCARAIMTSDSFPKSVSYQVKCPEGTFRVGAMAKGAGMIDPNMATMLCLFTTDASVDAASLRGALKAAVAGSFNCITVDGDMSTNDTVIALASGDSGVRPSAASLRAALDRVLGEMARMIVKDGEGVSRLVEVRVEGAATAPDARRAANAVANSKLVKCAWAGGDPNWGRILCALGYSGARLVESRVDIDYDKLSIVRGGRLAKTPWDKLRAVAARKEFRVTIRLGLGNSSHEVWTTDLTEDYVKFNLGE